MLVGWLWLAGIRLERSIVVWIQQHAVRLQQHIVRDLGRLSGTVTTVTHNCSVHDDTGSHAGRSVPVMDHRGINGSGHDNVCVWDAVVLGVAQRGLDCYWYINSGVSGSAAKVVFTSLGLVNSANIKVYDGSSSSSALRATLTRYVDASEPRCR